MQGAEGAEHAVGNIVYPWKGEVNHRAALEEKGSMAAQAMVCGGAVVRREKG